MNLKSFLFAALVAGAQQTMAQAVSLIPQPREMYVTRGLPFVFDRKMRVSADQYPGDSIEWVFRNFEKELTESTGIRFKNASARKADIRLIYNLSLIHI